MCLCYLELLVINKNTRLNTGASDTASGQDFQSKRINNKIRLLIIIMMID